jgi:hypothetical protein
VREQAAMNGFAKSETVLTMDVALVMIQACLSDNDEDTDPPPRGGSVVFV